MILNGWCGVSLTFCFVTTSNYSTTKSWEWLRRIKGNSLSNPTSAATTKLNTKGNSAPEMRRNNFFWHVEKSTMNSMALVLSWRIFFDFEWMMFLSWVIIKMYNDLATMLDWDKLRISNYGTERITLLLLECFKQVN